METIVNIMVEVLAILALATKELKQNRASGSILRMIHLSSLTVVQRGF